MVNNQIFEGLKVLELASVLAGPSVGQFFAELGATVTKIENPATRGDVTRSWKLPMENPESPVSSYFASANWGKEHIFLNLKDQYDEVVPYIRSSDIVICSFKPGAAIKLKVDYESIRDINPDIIYGNISGYGEDDSRVGYDAVLQAESGLMYMNGEPEGLPTKLPIALVDIIAAHQLKEGILAALLQKERTGKGAFVEVSLFKSAISCLANQGTNYLNAKHIPQRMGSEHPNIAPYGKVYLSSDDKALILAIGNDLQFNKLCKILELDSLASDKRFCKNELRVKNRDELNRILGIAIRKKDRDFLINQFHQNKIPAGPVNNMKELFDIPKAQEMILEYDNNSLKGIRNVGFKLK